MLFLTIFKIFFARIIDVSLGTFRTILTVKGKIAIPTIIAFFEVLIWFYVAMEALSVNESKIIIAVSYSLGYATGNLIGSIISKRFINSLNEVKVYHPTKKLINVLGKYKYSYYIISKNVITIYVRNSAIYKIINLVNKYSKKSILYIGEAKENNNLQYKNNML